MQGEKLIKGKQLRTKTLYEAIKEIEVLIFETNPDVVAYEDYRVYAWEAEKHKWAALHTPKVIGCIVTICHLKGIPCYGRMAQTAKNWVTDDKLKPWGLYTKGQRHTRDAIRHAVYQLVFGKPF
jgi:hypothetical protein